MDRCWAFCLAYNESVLIPYWVRHYRAFCERVLVYVDADSDDGTASLAVREGAEVRFHSTGGALDDAAFVAFAADRYKEARGAAAWAVWVDADEFVYHPRIAARLDALRAAGVTLPRTAGYAMVADAPPTGEGQIWAELRRGFPAPRYAKVAVFDPALDVAWGVGKHDATAPGAVPDDGADPLKLLHYRWLGADWCVQRNARNYARVPATARSAQFGKETYPDAVGDYTPAWYAERAPGAVEVVP